MTASSDSTEMIREGGEISHSHSDVTASSPQFGSHVVEKAEEEVAGMAEEALNNEEFHLIEEIQNLNLAEDDVPSFVAPIVPEEDPMIFQPIFYGGANGEFTPCVTPPEPASDFVFPPDMAQAIPWHPIGAPMQPFDPEMPQQFIAYPPGWGEMQPGCVPGPLDVSQQNLAYHAYPIFQPIPTFVGQPFFHRRNGSAPGTPNRHGNGGGNGNNALRECYNCRRPGHLARNCGEVASDKQCFHCLKFGHVVRNCPQTRNHQNNNNKRDGFPDPRLNGSLSSSPTYLEWSSDSGDPSSDCNDTSSPSIGSPMPTEYGCFNPPDYDVNPVNARFYIIKSNSEQDIRASIEHGIWCSTDHGNKKLDNSFKNHHHNGPTILLFSVNNSGKFCGIAEMTSRVDFNRESGVWSNNRFRGQFRVRWTHVKDVPNSALRHIYLANNDFKPVTFSRDTQEVPPREGKRMLYIVHKYQHVSSMLDPISEKDGRSDGEEDDDATSSSLNLEDEEAQFQQRLQQHRLQQHRGGGGGGGGEMYPFPAAIAYPQFAAPVPPTAYGAPFLPYHIVPVQNVEWNQEQQQQQQPQQPQMHPLPYPAPLMAIPTSSPVPLEELPVHPNDNEQKRRQQQRQPQQSPSLSRQSSPQHQQRPQQLNIVNSLEEFPSLPKKTVITPLTAQAS